MGRPEQRRKKEKRFKQTNRLRIQSARAEAAELEQLRKRARERGLELATFEITHEAMPDPLMEALPESDRAEIDAIGERLFQDAAPLKERLEALVARHPHIPTLKNWLMLSVSKGDDPDRADRLAEEIFLQFPTYLFGVAQWVMSLLGQGRIDDATGVLKGRLGLREWWPERRTYHATEFVVFNAMLGHYFLATGDRKAVGAQLELIRDILPDHPGVRSLENAVVLEALRLLAEEVRGGGPMLSAVGTQPARRLIGLAGAG